MSTRPNSWRQGVFLDLQTVLDGIVVTLSACRIADDGLIEPGVFAPDAPRFKVCALRRADDHSGQTSFRSPEQPDLRFEDVANGVGDPPRLVKVRSTLARDVHKWLMRYANVVGCRVRRIPHWAALLSPVLVGPQ